MRILLATPLVQPESGGPATYTALLEKLLPARGVSVEVLPFSSVRHLPKIIRHGVYGWKVFRAARRVDAVYALDPVSTGLPALCGARCARKPFFLKVVGDYAWEQGVQRFGLMASLDTFLASDMEDFALPVRVLRFVESVVARAAQKVVVPSHYLASVVASWGVPRNAIVVIPNAFTPGDLPTASKVALRSSRNSTGKTIVSVGRFVPWKGFDTLLRMLALPAFVQVSLRLVGDGPDEARLRRIARECGVEDHVTFCGLLAHPEVMAEIAAADAFVLATGYEGLSHVLLEAIAVGTPIVTTRIGGNPETLDDGAAGLLVPHDNMDLLAEAVELTLAGGEDVDARVAHGKSLLVRYDQDHMGDETAALLRGDANASSEVV